MWVLAVGVRAGRPRRALCCCESDDFFSSKGWMSAGSVPAGMMWRRFCRWGVNLQRPGQCHRHAAHPDGGEGGCAGPAPAAGQNNCTGGGKSARRSYPINANGLFRRSANNAVRLARRRRAPGTGFLFFFFLEQRVFSHTFLRSIF